jgi:hypothetical protein
MPTGGEEDNVIKKAGAGQRAAPTAAYQHPPP